MLLLTAFDDTQDPLIYTEPKFISAVVARVHDGAPYTAIYLQGEVNPLAGVRETPEQVLTLRLAWEHRYARLGAEIAGSMIATRWDPETGPVFVERVKQ